MGKPSGFWRHTRERGKKVTKKKLISIFRRNFCWGALRERAHTHRTMTTTQYVSCRKRICVAVCALSWRQPVANAQLRFSRQSRVFFSIITEKILRFHDVNKKNAFQYGARTCFIEGMCIRWDAKRNGNVYAELGLRPWRCRRYERCSVCSVFPPCVCVCRGSDRERLMFLVDRVEQIEAEKGWLFFSLFFLQYFRCRLRYTLPLFSYDFSSSYLSMAKGFWRWQFRSCSHCRDKY